MTRLNRTSPVRPGIRLIFYTDGITEAQTTMGEMFGFGRLTKSLARNEARTCEQLVQDLMAEVEAFASGNEPNDDQTILITCLD